MVFGETLVRGDLYQHELGHVTQYEELGMLFLPAYSVAGLAALPQAAVTGESVHDSNFFEYSIDDWGWWQ